MASEKPKMTASVNERGTPPTDEQRLDLDRAIHNRLGRVQDSTNKLKVLRVNKSGPDSRAYLVAARNELAAIRRATVELAKLYNERAALGPVSAITAGGWAARAMQR